MAQVRKAVGYQGDSPGSRSKSRLSVRAARRAAAAVTGMFAAAYRAELRAVRA